jgi:hypothetical protein
VRLPIDTSRLQFLVVAGAEPLKQYEEGKPREARGGGRGPTASSRVCAPGG